MPAAGPCGDHPSAALNIAALIETVANRPGRRILNAADPDCPDGRTIASIIAGPSATAGRKSFSTTPPSKASGATPGIASRWSS